MVANLLALTFNPETPAIKAEEIVMNAPFCCIGISSTINAQA